MDKYEVMEPESYDNNPTPYQTTPENDNWGKKMLILVAVFIILLIAFVAIFYWRSHRNVTTKIGNQTYTRSSTQPQGTMKITASGISDANGLSVLLNQSQLPVTTLVSTGTFSESLPKGNYTLKVDKTGYKEFSTQFTITPSQTTIITVALQPTVNTAITSWSQVKANGDPVQFDTPAQYRKSVTVTISNIQYFYNQTWAFITTYDGSQYGYEVARYDFASNSWIGVAGTDQFFSNSDVYSMPSDVQSYLEDNNYTYLGAQQ